jgi:hypothetical protein
MQGHGLLYCPPGEIIEANFAPGGLWNEDAVGTNALDLAMRTQTQQTVFSAEHFAPLVHGWVCYAAPIFDTKQNSCLGVIDISTTWDNANPLALMAVTSFAELISAEVSARLAQENKLRLKVLGTPRVDSGFGVLNLPKRQLEILFILSIYPQGSLPGPWSANTGAPSELLTVRSYTGNQ